MRLITRFELASHTTSQLRSLLRDVFNELACPSSDTAQRRNALASLKTIRTELASRPDGP